MKTRTHWPRIAIAFGTFFASTAGCSSSSQEGITIAVAIEAPTAPPLEGMTRTFDTDRGVHVTLMRGYLNTGSLELFACTNATSSFRWLDIFRERTAHAHVVGSPTLLGTPAVASLLAEEGTRASVGLLHPPPGSYCRAKQTILAADADALGLPTDGSMLGKSLLVEGTFADGDGEARAFSLSSTASFDVESTIPETALSVDGRRTATIVLATTSDRWFDGVDLAGDEHEATTRILENLRGSLGARVE